MVMTYGCIDIQYSQPDLQKIRSNSSLSKDSRYVPITVLLYVNLLHSLFIYKPTEHKLYFKFIPTIMIKIQLFIFKTVYTDWN